MTEVETNAALHPTPVAKRNWMPVFLLVAGLLLVGLLLLAGWLPRRKEQQTVEQESRQREAEVPKIEAARVSYAKTAAELAIPGTTMAYTEAYIYARASGYLSKRLVDIGDYVRSGQLLAVIDAPDLDKQVAQAESTLDQSRAALLQVQAQLHLSDLTWQRYKVLVARGVFSRQDGDQQEANYRVAEANVKAAENTVSANEANLNRLRVLQGYEQVRAPFSGVITARNVDVGTLINTNGSGSGQSSSTPTPGLGNASAANNQGASGNLSSNVSPSTGGASGGTLFSLASTDTLRILVSVPERYRQDIRVGQRATLEFDERRAGLVQRGVEGTVTRTSASIDQNTRTLLVEVQVRNRYRLVPGMYVVVHFIEARRDLPLVIPGSAIVVRNGKPAVAMMRNDTVHFQQVSIGRDFGDQAEIVGGLAEGDIIAVNVTDELSEGAKVQPQVNGGKGGNQGQGGEGKKQGEAGSSGAGKSGAGQAQTSASGHTD